MNVQMSRPLLTPLQRRAIAQLQAALRRQDVLSPTARRSAVERCAEVAAALMVFAEASEDQRAQAALECCELPAGSSLAVMIWAVAPCDLASERWGLGELLAVTNIWSALEQLTVASPGARAVWGSSLVAGRPLSSRGAEPGPWLMTERLPCAIDWAPVLQLLLTFGDVTARNRTLRLLRAQAGRRSFEAAGGARSA